VKKKKKSLSKSIKKENIKPESRDLKGKTVKIKKIIFGLYAIKKYQEEECRSKDGREMGNIAKGVNFSQVGVDVKTKKKLS
jgi:hypothetical protein